MKHKKSNRKICRYAIIAGFLLCLIIFPAAAESLTINEIKEPVILGETIEFTGTSSLPAGTQLEWSFGADGYTGFDPFMKYPKDQFRYFEKGNTLTTQSSNGGSKYKLLLNTQNLKTGYYNFQIAGNEKLAEAIVIIDDGEKYAKSAELSEISDKIDFYKSPNSKIILDDSSKYLTDTSETNNEQTGDFPSAHISAAKSVVRGNALSIDMFTIPVRQVGLWLYSVFPDNSYRYFAKTASDNTGKTAIFFDTDVTSNLKTGDYYVFAEISGKHYSDLIRTRPRNSSYSSGDYLTITPDSGVWDRLWSDPEGKFIVSPASSIALDAALKAGEDESKYLRFKINVEDPWINLDKISDVSIGEDITISGTTNFEKGTLLNVDIIALDDKPNTKTIAWTKGTQVNTYANGQGNWRTSVNSYNLGAGEYIIRVNDREHKLTEDDAVIQIVDSTYGMENTEDDSLLVKSYSVDPVSKKVVHLNEGAEQSPIAFAVLLSGIGGGYLAFFLSGRRIKK
ncbi:MAG: hypothetical protein PHV39_00620 [Methanomicrobium sp.]|nr:hypothetical protein [Methanomicrobium sp.]